MGREMNDKLQRKLQDSICLAIKRQHMVSHLLVTDVEDADYTLIELVDSTSGQVVDSYLVKPTSRPTVLRYREKVDASSAPIAIELQHNFREGHDCYYVDCWCEYCTVCEKHLSLVESPTETCAGPSMKKPELKDASQLSIKSLLNIGAELVRDCYDDKNVEPEYVDDLVSQFKNAANEFKP